MSDKPNQTPDEKQKAESTETTLEEKQNAEIAGMSRYALFSSSQFVTPSTAAVIDIAQRLQRPLRGRRNSLKRDLVSNGKGYSSEEASKTRRSFEDYLDNNILEEEVAKLKEKLNQEREKVLKEKQKLKEDVKRNKELEKFATSLQNASNLEKFDWPSQDLRAMTCDL